VGTSRNHQLRGVGRRAGRRSRDDERGRGGSIVITGSAASLRGYPASPTTSAKHGAIGLMRPWRSSWRPPHPRQLRAAGGVRTPMGTAEAMQGWLEREPEASRALTALLPVDSSSRRTSARPRWLPRTRPLRHRGRAAGRRRRPAAVVDGSLVCNPCLTGRLAANRWGSTCARGGRGRPALLARSRSSAAADVRGWRQGTGAAERSTARPSPGSSPAVVRCSRRAAWPRRQLPIDSEACLGRLAPSTGAVGW